MDFGSEEIAILRMRSFSQIEISIMGILGLVLVCIYL